MNRQKGFNLLLNSLLPIIFALTIGAVIILILGENPLNVYSILFGKSFFTLKGLMITLHTASPLIITGLAIAITFRAKIYNMGVEGQVLIGGFVAGILGAYLHISNPILHKTVIFVVSIVVGASFALVPALLRAYLRVDELVVTLTLNYAVLIVLEYLSSGIFRDRGAGYVSTPLIDATAMFSRIGTTRITLYSILVLLVLALFVFLIKKTSFGYRNRAIGENPRFAEATGLRVRKHIIIYMLISGALAGFAGAGHMMSQEFRYTLSFSGTIGIGWDGMLVALLGNHNPIGILFSAIFYGALKSGADNIAIYTSIPKEIVGIIQGLMILFLSVRFIKKNMISLKRKKGAKHGDTLKNLV